MYIWLIAVAQNLTMLVIVVIIIFKDCKKKFIKTNCLTNTKIIILWKDKEGFAIITVVYDLKTQFNSALFSRLSFKNSNFYEDFCSKMVGETDIIVNPSE